MHVNCPHSPSLRKELHELHRAETFILRSISEKSRSLATIRAAYRQQCAALGFPRTIPEDQLDSQIALSAARLRNRLCSIENSCSSAAGGSLGFAVTFYQEFMGTSLMGTALRRHRRAAALSSPPSSSSPPSTTSPRSAPLAIDEAPPHDSQEDAAANGFCVGERLQQQLLLPELTRIIAQPLWSPSSSLPPSSSSSPSTVSSQEDSLVPSPSSLDVDATPFSPAAPTTVLDPPLGVSEFDWAAQICVEEDSSAAHPGGRDSEVEVGICGTSSALIADSSAFPADVNSVSVGPEVSIAQPSVRKRLGRELQELASFLQLRLEELDSAADELVLTSAAQLQLEQQQQLSRSPPPTLRQIRGWLEEANRVLEQLRDPGLLRLLLVHASEASRDSTIQELRSRLASAAWLEQQIATASSERRQACQRTADKRKALAAAVDRGFKIQAALETALSEVLADRAAAGVRLVGMPVAMDAAMVAANL